MDKQNELFGKRFWDEPPSWNCPKCFSGTLTLEENGLKTCEHGWSSEGHKHEAWEPEWISGSFYWVLRCSIGKCAQRVVVAGEYVVDWDIEDTDHGPEQVYKDFFEPKGFSEAPPVFEIQNYYPEEVAKHLRGAFAMLWVDPASCLNRLRQCIEDILTIEKIPRFSTNNGRRTALTLHSRIEKYRSSNRDAAEFLMALKWLGNDGSHSGKKLAKIERVHLLEAFEIMEMSLEKIFSSKNDRVRKRAKRINKKKGL